jgi:hypothetical protein
MLCARGTCPDSESNLKTTGPKVEWGSIVGQEYVRAGALAKAAKLAEFITPLADAHDNEQQGYVLLLLGIIASEKGATDKAVAELAPLTDPRFGGSVNGLATETIAHAYQHAGNLDRAIAWYERLSNPLGPLASFAPCRPCPLTISVELGWEFKPSRPLLKEIFTE